jgi:acyl transferase domain-containing protein
MLILIPTLIRNGKTPGIVQPSIDGQEAVIRTAYRRAGLATDETDIIEVRLL